MAEAVYSILNDGHTGHDFQNLYVVGIGGFHQE